MWAANKPEIKESEEKLLKMRRSTVVKGLTDKQIAFCEAYTRTNNLKLAAIAAGF